ncbi:MAG: hypothetical protein IJ800_02930 [Clostridia bacterium]|nr:hypothetical protein [Clostridia bacterium]
MTGLKTEEMRELVSRARNIKQDGGNLSKLFSEFAEERNMAKGTIRNAYYEILKRAENDEGFKREVFSGELLKTNPIVFFDEIESRLIVKKILIGLTEGRSVRRTVLEMGGDEKRALRISNKYRNMLKNDREVVEEVMSEVEREKGKCFDPYFRSEQSDELYKLKCEINALYARIFGKLQAENRELKAKIKALQ